MARTGTAIALVATLIATPALAQVYQYSDYDLDGNLELTDVEFERYSATLFERYDEDADNLISVDEYALLNEEMGPFAEPFEAWDTEPDNLLTEAEFHAGLFDVYDADDDLLVDEAEFGLYGEAEQVGGLDNTIQSEIVTLADWRYDELYAGGLSAEELIDDMDVYGPLGEEIGETEDLIVGSDGRILALIAEIGGFWDIGDTHVSIPWDMVEVGIENVVVPVTEDTVDDYGLFETEFITAADAASEIVTEVDDAPVGPRAWRISELIGDYARLVQDDGFRNYGYVNDVIIRNGQIAATVVSPDVGYGVRGYYAYPYTGYAGGPYYDLPYAEDEIVGAEPFEYDRMTFVD